MKSLIFTSVCLADLLTASNELELSRGAMQYFG
jgi:hypothetical protein